MLEKIKKARKDYKYTDTEVAEYWIEEIRKGFTDSPSAYVWGIAILEIGNFDIELNITSAEENRIDINGEVFYKFDIDYYICTKAADCDGFKDWFDIGYLDGKPNVDWNAENWRDQLERDMVNALCEFMKENDFDFDEIYPLKRLDEAFE